VKHVLAAIWAKQRAIAKGIADGTTHVVRYHGVVAPDEMRLVGDVEGAYRVFGA